MGRLWRRYPLRFDTNLKDPASPLDLHVNYTALFVPVVLNTYLSGPGILPATQTVDK